uniref:pigment epithelium-derived factor-like n=1 Tax=Myxine glutinosa TaxID=7769 RepID=UPI00358ED97C
MKPIVFGLALLLAGSFAESPPLDQLSQVRVEETPYFMHRLAESLNDFAFDLYRSVVKDIPGTNVFMSPLTTSILISMLHMGSGEPTELILARCLHLMWLKNTKGQATIKELLEHIHSLNSTSIAARIFIKKDVPLLESFIERAEKIYSAKPENFVGDKKVDIKRVNDWVKEKTDNMIKNFLTDLPDNVDLLLLSAIYFKGQWMESFSSMHTTKTRFYLSKQTSKQVEMMFGPQRKIKMAVYEHLNCEIGVIPFSGGIDLVVFLPKIPDANLTLIESSLSSSFFKDLDHKLEEMTANIYVPKFKIESEQNLMPVLDNLGLDDLFHHPNFSGISTVPLAITNALHKAAIEVSEEGVKAAAVTALMANRALFHDVRTPEFRLNRPFVFAIIDQHSRAVLFLGRFVGPDSQQQTRSKHAMESSDEQREDESSSDETSKD